MVIFQAENKAGGESLLVIVIERDNLERMEKGDPITLKSKRMGGLLTAVEKPDNMHVIVAFEQDSSHVYEFLQRQDKMGLLQYLTRGYTFAAKDGSPGKVGTA